MTITGEMPASSAAREPLHQPEGFQQLLLPENARLVHIGPPKTGTTALQVAMFEANRELERQGVHYATRGRHAMSAVLAGVGLPSPWSEERKPPPRWKWTDLLRKVRTSRAKRVVISSEVFADANPDAIRRVIDELDPDRVHVVVTLRPLARILPSQWQQWVQNLWITPFDEWIRELLDEPGGEAGEIFWRRHRHDKLIERWASVVGRERVTAIVIDEADHGLVLRAFEGLTGLAPGTLRAVPEMSNRSLTLPEIEVVRAFNQAYRAERLPRTLYTRVMRFGAAAVMEAREPGPGEQRITLPGWAIEPIAAMSSAIVAGIRASGVRVVGDLDSLAVPAEPGPATSEEVRITPDVAASAAMGVLLASGLARGTGRITRDAAGGEDDDIPTPRAPRPVQEPSELLRISTTQLVVVLLRRARAEVLFRVRPLMFWRRFRRRARG